ncbi:MAG: hypothetical protein V3S98_05675 [Dehalococcoidia bacterium]
MEISGLKAGETLWLEDGSMVEVIEPSRNGKSVRVKYVESPFDGSRVGAEAECTDYEIISYADKDGRADSTALT